MSFRDDADRTVAALQAYAENAAQRNRPVLSQTRITDLAHDLDLKMLIAEGGLEGNRLQNFLDRYLTAATCLHHPRYMAHQVAVPVPQAALAALIDGFTSNPMAIYEMGPGAAAVESVVLNWMMEKIGWRNISDARTHGEGVLTHGGSIANLTALLAARARIAPNAWTDGVPSNLVLVCSSAAHYSISRSAAILGLGASSVRLVGSDPLGRIDPSALARLLAKLREDGKQPMAVVANAGSTALGLFDPLREIAAVCRSEDVWLHVDGAHGASQLLSSRLRPLLDGIDEAHSVVWDAHKLLRAPLICAAVLVRDQGALTAAFRQEASYLFHDKDQPGIDFIYRSIECTKAALGLKIFFALAYGGESAIAETIEQQADLATAAAELLGATPGIEIAVKPETNIVCFRVEGPDDLQLAIRRRLTSDGSYYVSTAEALGKRWLRLALMNPATTLEDIASLRTEVLRLRNTIS